MHLSLRTCMNDPNWVCPFTVWYLHVYVFVPTDQSNNATARKTTTSAWFCYPFVIPWIASVITGFSYSGHYCDCIVIVYILFAFCRHHIEVIINGMHDSKGALCLLLVTSHVVSGKFWGNQECHCQTALFWGLILQFLLMVHAKHHLFERMSAL